MRESILAWEAGSLLLESNKLSARARQAEATCWKMGVVPVILLKKL